ncbi:N-acetyltransferase, partial [Dickeya undicola]
IGRWLPWCVPHYDLAMAQSWITYCEQQRHEGTSFDLAITDRTTGHLLGSIAINSISKAYRLGNIGYWVRRTAQGQGIIPEAVREIVPFGFGTLGLTR